MSTVICKVNRNETIEGNWTHNGDVTFNGEIDLGDLVVLAQDQNLDLTGTVQFSNHTTYVDAKNVVMGTATGTKIGTATSQKIGLWNATPVIQPAASGQAALTTVTTAGSNGTASGAGLSLISDTSATNQAAAIMADFTALREDILQISVLVTAMRNALIAIGAIKGAA